MSEMFDDLRAAQMEMPQFQKNAQNPHFKHNYTTLDDLLPAVLPILNKHNFVLLQQPTFHEGQPALRYRLLHKSGEEVTDVMPLLAIKDDPQAQGSAITYARRYSLVTLLGLSAEADDDGNSSRPAPRKAPAKTAPKQSPNGATLASEAQVRKMYAVHKELTPDAQMALEGWLKRVQPSSIVEGEPPHFGRIQSVMADRVIEQMEKAPKQPVSA